MRMKRPEGSLLETHMGGQFPSAGANGPYDSKSL